MHTNTHAHSGMRAHTCIRTHLYHDALAERGVAVNLLDLGMNLTQLQGDNLFVYCLECGREGGMEGWRERGKMSPLNCMWSVTATCPISESVYERISSCLGSHASGSILFVHTTKMKSGNCESACTNTCMVMYTCTCTHVHVHVV